MDFRTSKSHFHTSKMLQIMNDETLLMFVACSERSETFVLNLEDVSSFFTVK